MTLKKALLRGLVGIPVGVFISQLILLIISLGWGEGNYITAVPKFIEQTGGELAAVALQFLFCSIMGFAFAAASAIFEVEQWGITKQTLLHLAIISVVSLPIAVLLGWAGPDAISIITYFATWFIIYAVIWALQYAVWRNKMKRLNHKINSQ